MDPFTKPSGSRQLKGLSLYGLNAYLRASFIGVLATAAALFCSAAQGLVISQVYGGGGNSGALYKNDFIEIFNDSAAAIDLSALSVQYASASGTSWHKTDLSGTLDPYHYYLIQEAAGSGGTSALPSPDAIGSINLAASSGKVALVEGTALLPALACPSLSILDFIGYGSANCFEGAAAASASSTLAELRLLDGLMDTNDNFSDFAVLAPDPRNSASPANAPISLPGPDVNPVSEPISLLLVLAGGLITLPRLRRNFTVCEV
jgi:predicted extracellular nuclease